MWRLFQTFFEQLVSLSNRAYAQRIDLDDYIRKWGWSLLLENPRPEELARLKELLAEQSPTEGVSPPPVTDKEIGPQDQQREEQKFEGCGSLDRKTDPEGDSGNNGEPEIPDEATDWI